MACDYGGQRQSLLDLYGHTSAGDAPTAQADRLHLPALRPNHVPLPEAGHGRSVRAEEFC